MMKKKLSEKKLRRRARNHVLMQGSPRLYMFCVLAVSLLTAFLASAILLHLGVTRMWIRYGVAAIVGYAAFFLYLHVLLFYVYKIQADKARVEADVEDVVDLAEGATDIALGDASDSGGGSSSGGLDSLELFGEGEAVAVVIAIVLILGVFIASFYVIYIAPEILFEIAFDALVGVGYFRILKSGQNKHWSESAIKATLIPFLITLLLSVVCGALLQAIVPDAVRFKDIFVK